MFGRFRNRRMARGILNRLSQPGQFPAEGQANQLLKTGQYRQAAPIFAQLAQSAREAGRVQKAATLYARSALAGAASRDAEFALLYTRQALQGLQDMGMLMRGSGVMAMILAELKSNGLSSVGTQLQHEFAGQFDEAALAPAFKAQAPQPGARLPATCPQCGAPVKSNEVQWIDATSAECAYCGGVIATL